MTNDSRFFFLVHWFGNLTLENTDSITCQLVAPNILIVIGNLVLGRSREISEYFNKREDSRGVGLDPSNVQRENLKLRTL